ncbi:MAG: hypothetical protein ACLQBD_32640 [Syntrophobacteraceae bacterium]
MLLEDGQIVRVQEVLPDEQ